MLWMNRNCWSVYKHTFPNGKVYIGITSCKPERRWQNGYGYNRQTVIRYAIDKYGWENIEHEVLYTNLSKEQASDYERELIYKYKSIDRKYGYNIDLGGYGKDSVSQETKEKISRVLKDYWKEHPKPTGWKQTPEAIERQRASLKGRKPGFGGKIHTKESIEKIRLGNCKTPVRCIETGKVYGNMVIAHEDTGANSTCICEVCKGRRKTAGGYHWEYVSKEVA